MQFIRKNLLSIGVTVVVAVAAALVFSFSGNDGAVLESTQESGLGSPVSRELLVVLGDLRTVTLTDTLFADPAFENLVDFGVAIPLQPVGRRNPFAPLGAKSQAAAAGTTQGQ